MEGYRGGRADRPAANLVFVEPEDARYVEASWAGVCALLGDEIGSHTAAGWQTTIIFYDDAGLLAPAPVDRGGPGADGASATVIRVRRRHRRGRPRSSLRRLDAWRGRPWAR